MYFYPWYPALMLGVESNNVIDLRLRKIAIGDANAAAENSVDGERKGKCRRSSRRDVHERQ